jgi:glycosyltransferase involved in cell wall biosynthesis
MNLVYFSPVPWESFSQRPHKFVEWFHTRHDGKVLWIDPYPTRLPNLQDLKSIRISGSKARQVFQQEAALPKWMKVVRPRALAIEPLWGSAMVNGLLWKEIFSEIDEMLENGTCSFVFGKPSKLALQVIAKYPHINCVYDAMDDFPAFYSGFSRLAMTRVEKKISAHVSRVIVSSSALRDRFSHHVRNVQIAFNACSSLNMPDIEIKQTAQERPIMGYVGTIAQWFDWQFVIRLAEKNPSAMVRLIGPVFGSVPVELPQNVELRPACSHPEAIIEMQKFHVGLIPFKTTTLTRSVDPIKYYEYKAAGLPIISTNFGEMSNRVGERGVYIADEKSDLAAIANAALAFELTADEVMIFREMNSWSSRFDQANIF